jgi:hypothetical protein
MPPSPPTLERLQLTADNGACRIEPADQLIDQHTDGAYSVLHFEAGVQGQSTLTIGYRLFADLDPQHKGLLRLTHDGVTTTAIFDPARAATAVAVGAGPAAAIQRLRARRRVAHLDRLRPHPVPAVAAAAGGACWPRRPTTCAAPSSTC